MGVTNLSLQAVTLVSGDYTESRGGVKWASRIAGEVGGGYSHRQGEVLIF